MRLTHEKLGQLRALKLLLRKACHAPGCDRVQICPRQCRCRTQRQFELNTDTAICWEITEFLFSSRGEATVTKADVKEITDKISAYAELSRHHSSRGWEKFFWDVRRTFSSIMGDSEWWSNDSPEPRIQNLKNRIGRLKRYPKL